MNHLQVFLISLYSFAIFFFCVKKVTSKFLWLYSRIHVILSFLVIWLISLLLFLALFLLYFRLFALLSCFVSFFVFFCRCTMGQRGRRWPFWCNVAGKAEPWAVCMPRTHMEGVRREGDSETLGFLNCLRPLGLLGLYFAWAL